MYGRVCGGFLPGLACLCFAAGTVQALIIDDFTDGAISITHQGPWHADPTAAVQAGLDPDAVLGGGRELSLEVRHTSDVTIPATLTIDPDATDGRFQLRSARPQTFASEPTTWFVLRYGADEGSALGLDASAHGNAFILHNVRHSHVVNSLSIGIKPAGETFSGGRFIRLQETDEPYDLIVPFGNLLVGDQITIAHFAGVDMIRLAGSLLPHNFTLSFDSIGITSVLPGDANLDGRVDGEDFLIWQSFLGSQGASWTMGDFNSDGRVDGEDFLIWQANFGAGGGPETTAAVPEPAAGALLAAGLMLLARRGRSG